MKGIDCWEEKKTRYGDTINKFIWLKRVLRKFVTANWKLTCLPFYIQNSPTKQKRNMKLQITNILEFATPFSFTKFHGKTLNNKKKSTEQKVLYPLFVINIAAAKMMSCAFIYVGWYNKIINKQTLK